MTDFFSKPENRVTPLGGSTPYKPTPTPAPEPVKPEPVKNNSANLRETVENVIQRGGSATVTGVDRSGFMEVYNAFSKERNNGTLRMEREDDKVIVTSPSD